MKKITAIILLSVMALLMLGGCKQEGDMIETMVSTIFSTESATNNGDTGNSGTVTDGDGHIGNEDAENSTTVPATSAATSSTSVADDNVL